MLHFSIKLIYIRGELIMAIFRWTIDQPLAEMSQDQLCELREDLIFQYNRFSDFLGKWKCREANGDMLITRETIDSIEIAIKQVESHIKSQPYQKYGYHQWLLS